MTSARLAFGKLVAHIIATNSTMGRYTESFSAKTKTLSAKTEKFSAKTEIFVVNYSEF
jgi:hypothetical protein